jgi:hypothetical protein
MNQLTHLHLGANRETRWLADRNRSLDSIDVSAIHALAEAAALGETIEVLDLNDYVIWGSIRGGLLGDSSYSRLSALGIAPNQAVADIIDTLRQRFRVLKPRSESRVNPE